MSAPVADKFGEYIGVSDVYIAEVTEDSKSAYTVGTPEYLAPVANVLMEPSVAVKTRHYDNKAYYSTATEGETKVSVDVSGLPLATSARILGKHYDATAKRLYDSGDASKAPHFALGFKTDVEGGEKYFWFLKGKFSPFKEEAATRTNDIDEKPTALEYTALVTVHDTFKVDGKASPCKRVVADTREDETLTSTTWFASVQKPAEMSA